MEKKFESELGKRIVEGNRRKVTKKVALAAFAIITVAAFFGAAAFSVVTSAKAGPPYMTAEDLVDHEQSTINNDGGSIAVSRVMTLMTRAFDIEAGGGAHMDCFKFVYVMNVQVIDADSIVLAGDAIGDLALAFDPSVARYPIGPVLTVTATTYAADGTSTPVAVDVARGAVTMDVEYIYDEAGLPVAYSGIAVDANSPVQLDSTVASMQLYIEVMIYNTPDIDGEYAETAFGDPAIGYFDGDFSPDVPEIL